MNKVPLCIKDMVEVEVDAAILSQPHTAVVVNLQYRSVKLQDRCVLIVYVSLAQLANGSRKLKLVFLTRSPVRRLFFVLESKCSSFLEHVWLIDVKRLA